MLTSSGRKTITTIATVNGRRRGNNSSNNDEDTILELVRKFIDRRFIIDETKCEELSDDQRDVIVVMPNHKFHEIWEFLIYIDKETYYMNIETQKTEYYQTEIISKEVLKAEYKPIYGYYKDLENLIDGDIVALSRSRERDGEEH